MLVKLVVLEIVLWVICTVHHTTRATGYRSKLLLSCILKGTGEGTYINVCRQVGEILTHMYFANTVIILPEQLFLFNYIKHDFSARINKVQTYNNQLVFVLLVSPSAKSSVFSWSSSLQWHYRSRGGAAGNRGLLNFLKPTERKKEEKIIWLPSLLLPFVKTWKLFFVPLKYILLSILIFWIQMFVPLRCGTKNRIYWCRFCGDNKSVNTFLEGKMLLRLNKDNRVCVHTFEWAANSIERMYIT